MDRITVKDIVEGFEIARKLVGENVSRPIGAISYQLHKILVLHC